MTVQEGGVIPQPTTFSVPPMKPASPVPEAVIEYMDLETVLTEWRPGSHPDQKWWNWADEAAELFLDPQMRRATLGLLDKIAHQGILDPITLGNDGRVWDGHHRLLIARLLGIKIVPVDIARRGVKQHEVMEVEDLT